VDVMTALKAMTIWPAYQHFEESTKGSIERGKLADFVILSKDPTVVDPETLHQVKVSQTIKNGNTIYRRGDSDDDNVQSANAAAGDVLGRMLNHWQRSNEERGGNDHNHGPDLLMTAILSGLAPSQADLKH